MKQPRLATRSDPSPIVQIGIAFGEMLFCRHVSRSPIAVTGDAHKGIGPHLLGRELVFNVGLAWKQQQLRDAKVNGRDLNGAPGLDAPTPT